MPILMADGSAKPIEQVAAGDVVMAFAAGPGVCDPGLRPCRVKRLFRSTTTEWLVFPDGLTVTPGHLFLNERGQFERMDAILARGGEIVTAAGAVVPTTAERVLYGEANRHRYEEAEEIVYATEGGAALAPQVRRGWRTYNFEVEGLHTYIAGGYRVHNDSVADYQGYASMMGTDQSYAAGYSAMREQFGAGVAEAEAWAKNPGFGKDGATMALNAAINAVQTNKDWTNPQINDMLNQQLQNAINTYNYYNPDAPVPDVIPATYQPSLPTGDPGAADTGLGGLLGSIGEAIGSIGEAIDEALGGLFGGDNGDGYDGGYNDPGVPGDPNNPNDPNNTDDTDDPDPDQETPVLLDLTGDGLKVTPLSSSTTYLDSEGNGYQHRTAWAGVGNGVLVLDASHDGRIHDKDQYAFTGWDPTATGDLQALKDVFDTNHNGKLDAGDARWADFKVMVNGQMVTLASLGIQSIDLTATGSGQTVSDFNADGSLRDSTVTTTDTSTRTVTIEVDGDGALDQTRSTVISPAGNTTVTTQDLNPDGSVKDASLVTTTNGGLARITRTDSDGDGTYDRIAPAPRRRHRARAAAPAPTADRGAPRSGRGGMGQSQRPGLKTQPAAMKHDCRRIFVMIEE